MIIEENLPLNFVEKPSFCGRLCAQLVVGSIKTSEKRQSGQRLSREAILGNLTTQQQNCWETIDKS